jgi:hypothetical protein
MSAIGKITRRTALAFSTIKLEINLREAGWKINDTVRVLYG